MVEDFEVHKKMISMFAPEVLEASVLDSVRALERQIECLMVEREAITSLVHRALDIVVNVQSGEKNVTLLRTARDHLIAIKFLTNT